MVAELRSYRRLALYIFLLVIVSLLVFFWENYMEEKEVENESRFSKLPFWDVSHKHKPAANKNISQDSVKAGDTPESRLFISKEDCYLEEPVKVIEACVRCTPFEKDALKASYCVATGYYDKIKCTKSGKITLRVCYTFGSRESPELSRFTLFSVFMCFTSFFFVKWRREIVEKQAYLRLQQQLEP